MVLQVWPELSSPDVRPWKGPPLLTDKVVTLLQLLDADRRRCVVVKGAAEDPAAAADAPAGATAAAAGDDEWWACMVFVETKVGVCQGLAAAAAAAGAAA
jgi:hypothetical protein